jgi:myo-inositol catabolism protein IolC
MTEPLYMLAFDHRRSLMGSFLGVVGAPSDSDVERARSVKRVIWEGLRRALAQGGASRRAAGILVDATYGEEVVRSARSDGVAVAVPVEASGRSELAFERPDWREMLEDLDPTWGKALVRYNPEGDGAVNARQRADLTTLSEHLHVTARGFVLELLVPPEADQLAAVHGDRSRYDLELRPSLMVRAMDELQTHGVDPDVWKLEGLDRRADNEAVAAQALTLGRADVRCVVLGRGADAAKVESWLRAAAGVSGYAGFAIGRSIWWDAARAYLSAGAGCTGPGDAATDEAIARAAAQIADEYVRYVRVYAAAASV